MKKNSLILNEADKTLMYLVGADEGHFSLYENMMSVKTFRQRELVCLLFITKETGTITLEVKNGDSAGTRVLDLSALEFGLDTTL